MKKFIVIPSRKIQVCFFVFALIITSAFSQNPYAIQLQGDTISLPENIETFDWGQMPVSSHLNNGYVGWIQFYDTPTQDVQDEFKLNGLQLIDYIPNKAYLFYFPEEVSVSYLQNKGVRTISPVISSFKLSSALKNPPYESWAMEGNNILVTLVHIDVVSSNFVIQDLAQRQIALKHQYDNSNNLELSIPDNCLEELSNLSYVKWVELIAPPPVPEDWRGRSLHRANGLDTQTISGRNYTGEGIGVMVRDDGNVGPHIDFQGRITNMAGGSGTHGDFVAGVLTGAANKNPSHRGMAAGSDLYVVSYVSSFLDTNTTNLIDNGTVQITNSSYGDGCNDGYNTRARTVDTQINDEPTLLHVFSCGNSGTSNCGYGAGAGWGNITGGHKQGKNVIATGSADFAGSLSGFSSRGPATDGRIKPDIVAHGAGVTSTSPNHQYTNGSGTSYSSPGIAGVAAQLYEAYADANAGALPQSALIKAAMLNTAQDKGNVGPDFKWGWGIVNGLRAGMLIEDGRFLSDNITQGISNDHVISIPAGTVQVRFMVYWNDPAATSGANPALVNDLDMIVTDPLATDHLPYVLDPTPNPTNLDTPATNGEDHLNNMEQVVINSPESGDYNINITGFNVPVGPQEYFIVYEVISENLTVTYPNGGEKITPNFSQVIHWDAVGITTDYLVEYSADNGANWIVLGNVNNQFNHFVVNAPNEVTGEGLIRVSSGSYEDVSDETFSIAPRVSGVNIVEVCTDNTATFEWLEVQDAESYDFYLLGEKYMEVVGTSTTNSITITLDNYLDPIWYAVSAKNATEKWEGLRSDAVNYLGGELNCILGVNETILNNLSMYPNPANEEVFVVFESTLVNETFEITITNSLGQVLQRISDSPDSSHKIPFNVEGFTSGLYFITISSEGYSSTRKLVVN